MQTTQKMKNIYTQIQKKLFYMIPEKWDKIYLYASVIEGINKLETGEMFFYYFPKGILKKDPINVYEVPTKFNIDETEYFKLADELYGILKQLRQEAYETNEKWWSNITISIENFKFMVEYHYDDLSNSSYNSYERHIIWRYQYLKTSINMYNKKERNIINNYIQNSKYIKEEKDTYIEGIYHNPIHNVIDYDKYDKEEKPKEEIKKEELTKRVDDMIKKQVLNTVQVEQKNQILNFKKWND